MNALCIGLVIVFGTQIWDTCGLLSSLLNPPPTSRNLIFQAQLENANPCDWMKMLYNTADKHEQCHKECMAAKTAINNIGSVTRNADVFNSVYDKCSFVYKEICDCSSTGILVPLCWCHPSSGEPVLLKVCKLGFQIFSRPSFSSTETRVKSPLKLPRKSSRQMSGTDRDVNLTSKSTLNEMSSWMKPKSPPKRGGYGRQRIDSPTSPQHNKLRQGSGSSSRKNVDIVDVETPEDMWCQNTNRFKSRTPEKVKKEEKMKEEEDDGEPEGRQQSSSSQHEKEQF